MGAGVLDSENNGRIRWQPSHVLRYIVPKRKLQPAVMPKSPQVVPSIRIIRRRDVVVGFF